MRAEPVTPPVAYHGEGPVWWPSGGVRWVDMLAGDVLTLCADGSVARSHCSAVVAAIRPRRGGGAVLGVERGFALEYEGGVLTRMVELWHDVGIRMNEGGCDPDGRFYCGSMAFDKRHGAAALYRLDPDGRVVLQLEPGRRLEIEALQQALFLPHLRGAQVHGHAADVHHRRGYLEGPAA
jgi:sugar lactone lactonase YvrE